MIREALPLLLALGSLGLAARAQDQKTPPAPEEVKAAFEKVEAAQRAFTSAFNASRPAAGKAPLPEALQKLRDAQEAEVTAFLARFGDTRSVPPAACLVVGRAHEMNRDYRAATDAYERFLSVEQPEREQLDALYQISMSALNSKDPERTAKWMRAFMDAEKDLPGTRRRSEGVRTSYYWRTLLELGRFEELASYGELLAKDTDSAAARAGGAQARFVAAVNLGRLEQAEEILQTLTSAPDAYPNLQGWAMQARLALLVHKGEAEKGAQELDAWLTRVAEDKKPLPASAGVETNYRRWLEAISSYLGKPAPAVVVDKWVGADAALSGKPLDDWKGKVVVLDFWQSWCEPCRNAMPHLVALQKAHADLRVVGLCRVQDYGYDVLLKKAVRPIEPTDYPAHVGKFYEDMKLNYPLGIGDTDANNRAYKVQGIPTLVVIDRGGIVRYMSIGAGEQGLLELAIEGVVGKSAPR